MEENDPAYDQAYSLLKISEGDEVHFNIVFEKYRNRIFTYLYKVTKSKETAEEIVLDVFLKLWYGREAVADIKNLEAFLYKVAHNKALDFFRMVKRRPQLQAEIWDLIPETISNETADEKIIAATQEQLLQEAVKQLPPQRGRVFHLRNNENMSYADIAKELDISPNTVRNHIAASVQFIREYLLKNDVPIVLLILMNIFSEKKIN